MCMKTLVKLLLFNSLQLLLYAVSEPHDGDFNGTSGADRLCYIESVQNEIPGAYLAFLSAMNRPIRSLVRASFRNLPIVNIRVSNL